MHRLPAVRTVGLLIGLMSLIPSSNLLAAENPTPDSFSPPDTFWMLVSSALVLMMTIPGLALFYCGMVRQKNVLATAVQ